MIHRHRLFSLFSVLLISTFAFAQDPDRKEPPPASKPEPAPVQTHHVITLDGAPLEYTATAGRLTLKTDDGKPLAHIFFVAYELENGGPERPVTFAFNGGPGSSAMWLHLGALGPRRVVLGPKGLSIPPSYDLVDNAYTWLPFTDLVFVDPIGTGFSRAAKGVDPKDFYNFQRDVKSMGRFIRMYLSKYDRWMSPKMLVGESYGTTRAAGLLEYLQTENGVNINGAVLISSVLNFQTISYDEGNDLPYILALPSMTAAAIYHDRLGAFKKTPLQEVLSEVEKWAISDYSAALARGDTIPPRMREKIADRLAKYTGLSPAYILTNELRVSTYEFIAELMRDSGKSLGLMDSRVANTAVSPEAPYQLVDPSLFIPTGPFVATFNAYVRQELQYKTLMEYEYLNLEISREWDWCEKSQGYLVVTDDLQEAMTLNSQFRAFCASGLYDLTCPYLTQEYSLAHLGLAPALRDRLEYARYPSGHQIYTSVKALEMFAADVARFYGNLTLRQLSTINCQPSTGVFPTSLPFAARANTPFQRSG